MEQSLPRKLAAILYADVAGYSRLTGEDEVGTHEQLSVSLDLMAERIAGAGGRVVHYAGDAVLADFDSVLAATRCAIGIQHAIGACSERYPEDRRLLFRIGINLGDVIVDRDDIYGDGVNIAARLESLAAPGGICVSAAVFDEISGKLDVDVHDLGTQTLKNIAHPVRAYRVVVDGRELDARSAESIRRFSAHSRVVGIGADAAGGVEYASRQLPSIMLLPFRSIGGGAEEGALVAGFRLSIQSVLVKLSGIFLVNAPPMEIFRGRDISAAQAGREAGVQHVLEGAAQVAGERIRVTMQLTDAVEGRVMWSDQYDRVVDDIFELQDEITAEVVTALGILFNATTDSVERFAWWEGLPDWQTREKVIRGINHVYKGTQADNAIARRMFEQVVERLPDLGQGLGLAALTHWLDVFRCWTQSPEDSRRKAIDLAERAVDVGDRDGFGAMVLGYERLCEGHHDEALSLSGHSAAVRSSCPMANGLYGQVLLYSGKPEAAITQTKHAVRVARWYPAWMVNLLAEAYRELGALECSISAARQSLAMDAENLDAHAILCTDYMLGGFTDDARGVAQSLLHLDPAFSVDQYMLTKPYKDGARSEVIKAALRSAGLP